MDAKLTLEEARATLRCRVCGGRVFVPPGQPKGWRDDFGEMVYPARLTLNFGGEFAHTECLEKGDGAAETP